MILFNRQSRLRLPTSVFVVLLCSALTAYGLLDFHENWDELLEASQGGLVGAPHWRAYQNRLLGPWSIDILSTLTGDGQTALKLFFALGITAHNLLLFALLLNVLGSLPHAVLGVALWSVGFHGLNHFWIYSWDIYDLLLFTLVSFAVVFRGRPGWLYPVYGVALLNRETALLIPLAMGVSNVFHHGAPTLSRFGDVLRHRSTLTLGALILFGMLWTKALRDWLFIRSSLGGVDSAHALIGNHNWFTHNLRVLGAADWLSIEAAPGRSVYLFSLCLIWLFVRHRGAGLRAGTVFFWIYTAFLSVFAVIDETRVLLPLLSLGMFILIAAFGAPPSPADQRTRGTAAA